MGMHKSRVGLLQEMAAGACMFGAMILVPAAMSDNIVAKLVGAVIAMPGICFVVGVFVCGFVKQIISEWRELPK